MLYPNPFTAEIRELERQGGDLFGHELLEAALRYQGEQDERVAIPDDGESSEIVTPAVDLPSHIGQCVERNDVATMLRWFGDRTSPEFKARINARAPDRGNAALLHICGEEENADIASVLLQLGADVDVKDSGGSTLLVRSVFREQLPAVSFESCGRLALEWGAATAGRHVVALLAGSESARDVTRAALLKSELGGRRCEVVGHGRSDLNWNTCVADEHLPENDEYRVVMEHSREELVLSHENLKRRDRTPQDPGYFVECNGGVLTRREFASNEECQAFVASIADSDGVAGAAQAEADRAAAGVN